MIDSSPDESTRDLVEAYSARLDIAIHVRPDLTNWRSKTNFGFSIARADAVCMLHQDDFWTGERARRIRAWLGESPGSAMFIHPTAIVDERGRQLGVLRCPLPDQGKPVSRDLLIERLLTQNFIAVPSPVIRRAAYAAVGGIDESLWYTGDWDLYLKLARSAPVVCHHETLSCFRIHRQSLTVTGSRDRPDFVGQMRAVVERHIEAVPEHRRSAVLRKARASIEVNAALASVLNGKPASAFRAIGAIVRLGPVLAHEYLIESRILDRALPRVRARMSGGL